MGKSLNFLYSVVIPESDNIIRMAREFSADGLLRGVSVSVGCDSVEEMQGYSVHMIV
jgi:hypothetical protein